MTRLGCHNAAVTVHVDRVVTSGFTVIDDRRVPLSNNTWVIGDDAECLVIDASHRMHAAVGSTLDPVRCAHRVPAFR